MKALVFDRPALGTFGRGRITIDVVPLAILRGFAPVDGDADERGGVLLGRNIVGTLDSVIDIVVPPMRRDVGGPSEFYRDAERHQLVINAAWQRGRGTCGYIGEWHTHDEDHPVMSPTDIETMQHRVRADRLDPAGWALQLIVGRKSIAAWQFHVDGHVACSVVDAERLVA